MSIKSETTKKPKLLTTLVKGSKIIEFIEDLSMSDDGWFISVITANRKNKNYRQKNCITQKQMPVWIEFYKNQGYLQS